MGKTAERKADAESAKRKEHNEGLVRGTVEELCLLSMSEVFQSRTNNAKVSL